ncbi:MAG: SGNH/GDSL hydrolase family protein [Pseudomonadales bacterium]|jgi:lysophospholipase L1-like esterase|nr:SGNH/GDSL hydrolase family protein [Pseudomonadales bacterium]
MFATGAALGLLPVAVAQFAWLRNASPRLRAARGPRHGYSGDVEARRLRLLVLGDDPAVGVGCTAMERSLAPRLAFGLAARLRLGIAWTVTGGAGWTVQRLDDQLRRDGVPPCDLAVVLIGADDAAGLTSVANWRRGIQRVRDRLLGSGVRLVAFVGVPALDRLPGLAWPLGTLLGRRARQLDRSLRELLERTALDPVQSLVHLPVPNEALLGFLARDGIHLSSAGYARWAAHMADEVAREWQVLPMTGHSSAEAER